MSKQTHTSGPWWWRWHLRDKAEVYDGCNELIATVWGCHHAAEEPNARLIAAAPDLLAACKGILAVPYGCPFCDSGELRKPETGHTANCPYLLARAAIARAEGRTP